MRFLLLFILFFMLFAFFFVVAKYLFYALGLIEEKVNETIQEMNETYNGSLRVQDVESQLKPFADIVQIAMVGGTLFTLVAAFIYTRRRE